MIIQVCGHLIETKYIYTISEVYSDTGYNAIMVYFDVKFLNDKSTQISVEKETNNVYYCEEYQQEKALMIKEMQKIRDWLICKWKASQLVIPKIEFNESQTTKEM